MTLINCKECGKEISDQAKRCPNCGAKTEVSNKQKKNIIIVLCVIVVLVVASVVISNIRASNPLYKYSRDTISILQDYKNNNITYNVAHDKIEGVQNLLNKEDIKQLELGVQIQYTGLSIKLSSIMWDLIKFKGLSNSQIDEYIKELKKY